MARGRNSVDREQVRATRSRFFQALALGLTQEEAEELANGAAISFAGGPFRFTDDDPNPGTAGDPHKFANIPIPMNYETLPWNQLAKLANSVSDEAIKNKEIALAAIAAELSRREAWAREAANLGAGQPGQE